MTTVFGTGAEDTELVINWGLGVDSSAYLVRMLENPSAHGVDLARTMVIHQITGSEWPTTYAHAEQYVLPLLREHRVRLVQVARASRALEIVVMDDSRRPERIVRRGPWSLEEDEYEANGTVPQQGGIRLCSLHAKGEVGDALIAQEIGGRPFRQVMGFNADEVPRSLRDQRASKNPLRQGLYPLIEWGWGRQRCEAFLYERFGVVWEKSYCTFCCFPISMGAMAAHLDRMRAHPDIGGRVLRLEYTSVSLNPKARLFGRDSLLEKFDPDRPADRPVLAAFEKELDCPWALYHVRRILPVAKADPTRRGRALRSVETVDVGRASALGRRLRSISERHNIPVEVDERYGRVRAWVQRRGPALPTTEELMVTAPLYVRDKQVPHFERAWAAHRDRA
ncbi:hypothetical protein ACFWPQ_40860 [Streptomyces sp. NPDC058464]|uniref:hypothetical protein n=1 Tax=Streptomyces sp. NPDC058464 TaxID=3346511 RepID=UPI00365D79EC